MDNIGLSGKRALDIEDLLRWAYVEELPKQGCETHSPHQSLLDYGTPIDVSPTSSAPTMFGEPHPDALLLDYKVRALPPITFTLEMAQHLLGELAPLLLREREVVLSTTAIRRGKRYVAGIAAELHIERIEEVERRMLGPRVSLSGTRDWGTGRPGKRMRRSRAGSSARTRDRSCAASPRVAVTARARTAPLPQACDKQAIDPV